MNADLNNANKTNRRRTVKTRSRFTTLLTVYFFVALIIPNCVLANTEPYSVWTVEALILMPLGFYIMWSVALRRSGVMIWLAFPFIFFCAFFQWNQHRILTAVHFYHINHLEWVFLIFFIHQNQHIIHFFFYHIFFFCHIEHLISFIHVRKSMSKTQECMSDQFSAAFGSYFLHKNKKHLV